MAEAATAGQVKEETAAMEAIVPLVKEGMEDQVVMADQGVVRGEKVEPVLEVMEAAERMGRKNDNH